MTEELREDANVAEGQEPGFLEDEAVAEEPEAEECGTTELAPAEPSCDESTLSIDNTVVEKIVAITCRSVSIHLRISSNRSSGGKSAKITSAISWAVLPKREVRYSAVRNRSGLPRRSSSTL